VLAVLTAHEDRQQAQLRHQTYDVATKRLNPEHEVLQTASYGCHTGEQPCDLDYCHNRQYRISSDCRPQL
jgi:hypothetical protein